MTDTPERTSNATHLQYHPVSNIFPLMQDAEFLDLKQDISEHGQLEPIWLHHDGSIIDGRNRYRACIDLGIEPKDRTWDGEGSITAVVVGLNLHRRHLTSGQCAAIAVEMLPMLEAEARERLREAAEKTNEMLSRKRDNGVSEAPEPRQADDSPLLKKLSNGANERAAAAHAAKYAHTNRTYDCGVPQGRLAKREKSAGPSKGSGSTEPGSPIFFRVELRFGVHHQADPVGMESYRLSPKWEWHINSSLNQNSDTAIIRPKWDL